MGFIQVVHKKGTLVAALGLVSMSIRLNHTLLKHLIVKAATSTTTFNVALTDVDGLAIFNLEDVTGELNEILDEIPTHYDVTLAITASSVASESFTYKLNAVEAL